MTPFTIRSWKENGQIKLEFGGASFSRAICQSAFWGMEKELNGKKTLYENLRSNQNGNLLITAILPESEPWETKIEIDSTGYDLNEIWSVVKTANKGLINYFDSNGL
jgi:hypothetical protein